MSAMRAVTSHPPARPTDSTRGKVTDSNGLEAHLARAGVDLSSLFGWQRVAFRRVEAASASAVTIEVGGRAIELPRAVLPNVQADQWLRFERRGETVIARVDLSATLRGETRLADLFQRLA